MFISRQIEDGNIEYDDEDMSPKKQAEMFRKDWDREMKLGFRTCINDRLRYGLFDYANDNEEVYA